MAIVSYPDSGVTVEHRDQIADLLGLIGVRFETWGVQRMPAHLRSRNLSDDEKLTVQEIFKPEIARLVDQGGYRFVDVISLYAETPGLDELLTRFDRKHTHRQHEIRFCIQGSGVFHLFPEGQPAVDVEMHTGDFISIPAGMRHFFTMTRERRFTGLRFFQTEQGWIADYCE